MPTGLGGDSNVIVAALQGRAPTVRRFDEGYFKKVSPTDQIVFPGDSEQMLARFSPGLLMTSTRDYSISPAVKMHSRLVRLGVPVELHIYEGLSHGEFLNIFIPESQQAATTITKLFDRYLTSSAPMETGEKTSNSSALQR